MEDLTSGAISRSRINAKGTPLYSFFHGVERELKNMFGILVFFHYVVFIKYSYSRIFLKQKLAAKNNLIAQERFCLVQDRHVNMFGAKDMLKLAPKLQGFVKICVLGDILVEQQANINIREMMGCAANLRAEQVCQNHPSPLEDFLQFFLVFLDNLLHYPTIPQNQPKFHLPGFRKRGRRTPPAVLSLR